MSFTLFSVAFSAPHRFKWIPVVAGMVVLWTFFCMGAGFGVEPGDGRFWARLIVPQTKQEINKRMSVRIGIISACLIAYFLMIIVFSFLVASGQGVATTYSLATSGVLVTAGTVIPLLIVWILFGIPNQAHDIALDNDGYAQRILVRILTAVASGLTGALFFVLHLGRGGLHNIKGGPLVAGIIFTTVIVLPIYKSIARAVWQRGVREVLNPKAPKESWRKMSQEVHVALYHPAKDEASNCSEKARKPEKPDRKSTNGRRAVRPARR